MLGLFSSCSEQGPLFIAVACLIAEHRRKGMQASVVVVHGINSCSLQALEHRLSSCGPGPSCSMAHGILLDQGSVSCIGRQILYHESSGKTFFSFLTKKIKSVTISIASSSICDEVMGPDAMVFVF